ncbi:MAG: phosphatase PAP2 family protein [Candidatus Hydrogenedentota bacterium]
MHGEKLTRGLMWLGVRLVLLAAGFAAVVGAVYLLGQWLVPLVTPLDRALLGAINPGTPVPFLDPFMRAVTDYSNFVIAAPLISWMVVYGLYRLVRRWKPFFTGVLAVNAAVFVVLCALGYIWPNRTYFTANVLLAIMTGATFSAAAYAFHRMDRPAMARFAGVFGLVLLSTLANQFLATNPIKEAIGRPRPLNAAHAPWNDGVRIIPEEELRGQNSYPSGHTSGTFALLTPIFWYTRRRSARAGLLGWSVLQGVSRVYTAAHFPFDVLIGGLLGFSFGTLVFFCLGGPRLRGREAEAPTGTPPAAP